MTTRRPRSKSIRVPKNPDPLQDKIDAYKARIATKQAAGGREAVPASVAAPQAPRVLAGVAVALLSGGG